MAILVKAYRPPSRGGVPLKSWKDDAACKDLPEYLFELSDEDWVTDDDQQKLIARGLKVCASCPVMKSCRVNSSPLDRYWTTRGGQPPEGLFPDSKRPKPDLPKNGSGGGGVKADSEKSPLKEKCKRGHNNWKMRADGRSRRCVTCEKEREANRPKRKQPPRNRHPKGGTI